MVQGRLAAEAVPRKAGRPSGPGMLLGRDSSGGRRRRSGMGMTQAVEFVLLVLLWDSVVLEEGSLRGSRLKEPQVRPRSLQDYFPDHFLVACIDR